MPSHDGHLHIKLHPRETEALENIKKLELELNPTTAPRTYAEVVRRLLIEKEIQLIEESKEGASE